MDDIADRYRRVAERFTARVREVPAVADEQTRLTAFTGRTP